MTKIVRFPIAIRRRARLPTKIAAGTASNYNVPNVSPQIATSIESGSPFRLGEWLVEPSLNRVSGGGVGVQLELKAMDVLVCLAVNVGELVEKRALLDEVWETEFVSDNTLTRRIAELRDALGDDVRNPRYIKTIPKRGYRLIAEVGLPEEIDDHVASFPGQTGARGEHERSPYPGLASFTEADADHFFGRDAEVSTLWRVITSRRLSAVIGPSGAGKSSLIRAGLIAGAPDGWRVVACEPGEAPFVALAQALAPDFAGHVDEVQQLLRFHDPDVALAMVSRWKGRWGRALIVVDQFEELFTLNPPEIQAQFIDLVRRLVDAADVHVLLVMRDDFLFECQPYEKLSPIFRDLTPVGPPTGIELRRAVKEPAASRLFAFESELLVDEMVAEVEEERGALPLLAFAMAQLWDRRDSDNRVLTVEAYERIGGVAGALAQHAEETLDAIGSERLPLVRELFRNLVTAKGTRAVREIDELLSVFDPDLREDGREILRTLIDARLVTAFNGGLESGDNNQATHRVEIVHESLLSSWPRLVRWQAQDADDALLRDQLRQSSMLWHERGRPNDLVWAGSSFREFQLWRERYPGGLSTSEQAFAEAMESLAGRRRRRRRAMVGALVAALLVVAVVVTALWQRSEHHARLVEARRLLQLGRQNVDQSPPHALAYVIASLEITDDPETRQLALDAIWRSPMPMALDDNPGWTVGSEFSGDGRWLSVGQFGGVITLFGESGEIVNTWEPGGVGTRGLFTPDSRVLLTPMLGHSIPTVWSVPEGEPLGTLEGAAFTGVTDVNPMDAANAGRSIRFVRDVDHPSGWGLDSRPAEILGPMDVPGSPRIAMHPDGSRMIVARGKTITSIEFHTGRERREMLVGQSESTVTHLALHPEGELVASYGENGEIALWQLVGQRPSPIDRWMGPGNTTCSDFRFNPGGTVIAAGYDDGRSMLWKLDRPRGAEPIVLNGVQSRTVQLGFHPTRNIFATASVGGVSVWPVELSLYPYVFRGHSGQIEQLAFGPEGRFFVSSATDGTVRYWPLDRNPGELPRVLLDWGHPVEAAASWMELTSDGRFVVSAGAENRVRLVSVDDGFTRVIGDSDQRILRVAVGPEGRRVAALEIVGGTSFIRIWDMESGEVIDLPASDPVEIYDHLVALQFLDDGRLLIVMDGDLYERPPNGSMRRVAEKVGLFEANPDGRVVIARPKPDRSPPFEATVFDLENGTSTLLSSHGRQVYSLAVNSTGTIVATGSFDGLVRVGKASGDRPHTFVVGDLQVPAVAVSPDGRWVASGHGDGSIRLWPMPDLDTLPFHTLPYDEFLAVLRRQTNLRVVPNPEHPGEYTVEPSEPFTGWDHIATR